MLDDSVNVNLVIVPDASTFQPPKGWVVKSVPTTFKLIPAWESAIV